MKVKCKFLDKSELEIEVNEDDTIEKVKQTIFAAKNNDAKYEAGISKLIYKGKILTNTTTAKAASVTDKGFFVVMPGKPTASSSTSSAAKPASVPAAQTTATTAATTTSNAPTPSTPTTAPPAPTATTPAASAPSAGQAITKEELLNVLSTRVQINDELISQIVAISNTTAQDAKTALLISQGNADMAVDLILSGDMNRAIDELVKEFSGASAAAANQDWQTTSTTESGSNQAAATTTGNSNNPLRYLTQQPEFNAILNQIRANPQMLPTFLQQVQDQNPQLFEQLSNNHEQFLELLQEESGEETAPAAPAAGAPATQNQPQRAAGQQPGTIQVQITPEDRQSIDTVMAITQRSEIEVVQAYMACDKDVNLTMNFLMQDFDWYCAYNE